jgi:hypothetical protein
LVEFLTPKKAIGAPLVLKKFETMSKMTDQNCRSTSALKKVPSVQAGVGKPSSAMD